MIRGKDACWMNVGMNAGINAGKIVEMIVGMNRMLKVGIKDAQ